MRGIRLQHLLRGNVDKEAIYAHICCRSCQMFAFQVFTNIFMEKSLVAAARMSLASVGDDSDASSDTELFLSFRGNNGYNFFRSGYVQQIEMIEGGEFSFVRCGSSTWLTALQMDSDSSIGSESDEVDNESDTSDSSSDEHRALYVPEAKWSSPEELYKACVCVTEERARDIEVQTKDQSSCQALVRFT